ncbi:hypothetical protein H7J88_17120 [Mycolicibacterium flavescens]|uniref:AMIN-like domain-containing protein n=1 Tax=Mycolicibacterium flavescens TaxID=1776 RepID=A0A1E3RML8_MYCFV|nr:hypothetical protein [Mycolicibacterium flavescens]MCV7281361.1 hypothetical protein [Mycolicibacterium flavescens]ODQ91133.1 hypothetical protein BHQ18_06975 [Mycolicibacterium flavescens]
MRETLAIAGVLVLLAGCGPAEAQPDRGTADVRETRPGPIAHLADVRVGVHENFDRLVLEFTDRVPGYTVGYRALPAHQDASGHEIPLPGADAMVQVTLNPATASGWTDGERTYFGPSTVSADTTTVTEVSEGGDFEAVLTWVTGLRQQVPFGVSVLDGPPRLVVDFG